MKKGDKENKSPPSRSSLSHGNQHIKKRFSALIGLILSFMLIAKGASITFLRTLFGNRPFPAR